MINILFPQSFLKKFRKLEVELQDIAIQKIDLFKDRKNHKVLEVHKLHGRFHNQFSFSVTHKYRIAFRFVTKNEALFLDIDDHDIYK